MKKLNLFVSCLSFVAGCSAVAVPTSGTVQFSSIPGFAGVWDKNEKRLDFPIVGSSEPTTNAIVVSSVGDFSNYFEAFDGDFQNGLATFHDFDYDNDFTGTELAPATIWSSEDTVGPLFDGTVSFSMTSITKTIEALGTGTTITDNGVSTFDGNAVSAIDSLRIFGTGIITTDNNSQEVNAEMTFESEANFVFSWSSTTNIVGGGGRPVPDETSAMSLMILGLVSLAAAGRRKTS